MTWVLGGGLILVALILAFAVKAGRRQYIQFWRHYPPSPTRVVDVVFDGLPGPEGPRFIEVEDEHGKSIGVGTWMQREDGACCLRLGVAAASVHSPAQAKAEPGNPNPMDPNDPAARRRVDEYFASALKRRVHRRAQHHD